MKTTPARTTCLLAAIGTIALMAATPAQAADVGVSVQISQPGIYGRVDIGQFPQPQVVMRQPIIVVREPQARPEPIYMWVPPGHRNDWKRHCRGYGACGVPVYFVQDQWYEQHVKRGKKDKKDKGHGDAGHDNGKDHGKGKDKH